MFLKLRHKVDRYVDIVNFTCKKDNRAHSKINELELENMKKENFLWRLHTLSTETLSSYFFNLNWNTNIIK